MISINNKIESKRKTFKNKVSTLIPKLKTAAERTEWIETEISKFYNSKGILLFYINVILNTIIML